VIAERLLTLRLRFLERSIGDRDLLRDAIEAETPDHALIGRIAHRLAGGGGTVGLPAISAAAHLVEDACDLGDAEVVREATAALCAAIADETAANVL
jgi:HPt (histidine-containing phosphotransfer) domain-containing protein